MSKRLILIMTFAFVIGIAITAYAEVQNVKVSGDLEIQGITRNSLTLRDNPTNVITGTTAGFGETITAILSTVRLRIDADLTDNVTTTLRLLNERVWDQENAASTDIDLDLAYVTLKEFLDPHFTLSLGRQELRFGNGFVIGDSNTNVISTGHGTTSRLLPDSLDDLSRRKAFDALRATFNYNPLVLDIICAKINENNVQQYDDVDLYGVNANYTVNKNLIAEAYLFQRTRDVGSISSVSNRKAENLRTVGARTSYTGIADMILGLESAFQFGDHVADNVLYPNEGNATALRPNRKVSAYAIQAMATYLMPKKKYTPVLGGSYTYLSGDKYLSVSDNYRGWDPMFKDQGYGQLFNKILAFTNAQLFNLNGSIKPTDDLKVALNYYLLRANKTFTDAASSVNLSGIAGDPTYAMKNGKEGMGSEVDLDLIYDYTEDVQFGLMTGAFFPGSAFDKANKKTASQVIGSMKVTF